MGAFIDGADRRRERLLTLLALVKARPRALAAQFGCSVNAAAMRANRTIRAWDTLKMSPSGFFIVEDWIGEVYGHDAPLGCYLHRGFASVCQVHSCQSSWSSGRRGCPRALAVHVGSTWRSAPPRFRWCARGMLAPLLSRALFRWSSTADHRRTASRRNQRRLRSSPPQQSPRRLAPPSRSPAGERRARGGWLAAQAHSSRAFEHPKAC